MLIAIDFDGTYGEQPKLFGDLAASAFALGYAVITVTSRRKTLENEMAMREAGIYWPIVFAYDKPKKLAAIEAGWDVNVWLDDQPHMIGDGTEDGRTVGVFENELRNALDVLRRLDLEFEQPAEVMELIDRLETVLGTER